MNTTNLPILSREDFEKIKSSPEMEDISVLIDALESAWRQLDTASGEQHDVLYRLVDGK